MIAKFGLCAWCVDGLLELFALEEGLAIRFCDRHTVHRAFLAVLTPSTARDVAAHDSFDGKYFEPADLHGPAIQSGSIRLELLPYGRRQAEIDQVRAQAWYL